MSLFYEYNKPPTSGSSPQPLYTTQSPPIPTDTTPTIPNVYPSSSSKSKSSSSSWSGLPAWASEYAQTAMSLTPWMTDTLKKSYTDYATQGPEIINQMPELISQSLLAKMPRFQEYVQPAVESAAARGIGDSSIARNMQTTLARQLMDNYMQEYAAVKAEAQQQQLQLLSDLNRMAYTQYSALPAFLSAGREATATSESESSTDWSDPLAPYRLALENM